jgi:membrane protein implicated in regulation of membrane protease activity
VRYKGGAVFTPSLDNLFLVSAILGGCLFLVQLVLQFLGGDFDGPGELEFGADASSDVAFKVLSLQGLSAFFLMFGLVGMALRNETGVGPTLSLLGASFAGAASTLVIRELFRLFTRLQSSGTLRIGDAVGATGTVYLSIEPGKPGKVTVVVGSRSLVRDAIPEGRQTLPTGTPIRVVQVLDDGVLMVTRLTPDR